MLRKLSAVIFLALSASPAALAQGAGAIDYRQLGAPMPPLRIVTDSGKVFTEKDVVPGENLFIMLFNPTCGHCEEAARLLGDNDSLFKDGQLYLMAASGMRPHLGYFEAVTHYKKHPVIRVGVDSSGFIEKTFNYQSLPELLIYDRNRRLVHTMNSTIPIDSLRPYLAPNARQWTGSLLASPTTPPVTGPFKISTPADERRKASKKRDR